MAAHAIIAKDRVTSQRVESLGGDKTGAADGELGQANPNQFGGLTKIVIPTIGPDNNLGDIKNQKQIMKSKNVRTLLSLTIMSMIVVSNIPGQPVPPRQPVPPGVPRASDPNHPSVSVRQPSVYVAQPSVYVAQPSVFVRQPSVFTNHPSVYVNRPPVFTNQPPVFTNYVR